MREGSDQGFTIVEVILFLAISGLVFLIGIAGVGTRTQQSRYTDSIRTLNSEIEQMYNDVFTGVNTADDSNVDCEVAGSSGSGLSSSDPGESGCYLAGKVAFFYQDSTQYDIFTLVATDNGAHDAVLNDSKFTDQSLEDQLLATDLRVARVEDKELKWGTRFLEGVSNFGDPSSGTDSFKRTDAIGFVRLPRSTQVYEVAFERTIGSDSFNGYNAPNIPDSERIPQNFARGTKVVDFMNFSTPADTGQRFRDANLCFIYDSARISTVSLGSDLAAGPALDGISDAIEIAFEKRDCVLSEVTP